MIEKNPFRFADSILSSKEYLMNTEDDEKEYNVFLMNRALSLHIDCIFHVQEIAKWPNMPVKWIYDYYFYSIRKNQRKYSKWPKKEKNETIDMLMNYYQVNRRKAEEYKKILTKQQIKDILQDMEKGGY